MFGEKDVDGADDAIFVDDKGLSKPLVSLDDDIVALSHARL